MSVPEQVEHVRATTVALRVGLERHMLPVLYTNYDGVRDVLLHANVLGKILTGLDDKHATYAIQGVRRRFPKLEKAAYLMEELTAKGGKLENYVFKYAWSRTSVIFFSLEGAEIFINACNSGASNDNKVELLIQLKAAKAAWEANEANVPVHVPKDKKRARAQDDGDMVVFRQEMKMERVRIKMEKERIAIVKERIALEKECIALPQLQGVNFLSSVERLHQLKGIAPPAAFEQAVGRMFEVFNNCPNYVVNPALMPASIPAPPPQALIADAPPPPAPQEVIAVVPPPSAPVLQEVLEFIEEELQPAPAPQAVIEPAVAEKELTIEEVAKSMGCDKDPNILINASRDIAAAYRAAHGGANPKSRSSGYILNGKIVTEFWYVSSDEAIMRTGMARAMERRRQQKITDAEKAAKAQARKAAAELKRQAKGKGKASVNPPSPDLHDGKHFTPEIAGGAFEEDE